MTKQQIQKSKPKRKITKFSKACTITLILQILCVVVILALCLSPYLAGFLATCIFLFAGVMVIITTLMSLGTFWAIEGFRNFWANVYNWIFKFFESPDKIITTLKPVAIWLSIVLFIASLAGFIVNLIYFIKSKQNKARFITSCIFVGLGLLNMILTICFYASI